VRSLWEVIDLGLDEKSQRGLRYGRFDARTGHGYGAVPGGKFSAKGGPTPVNTANQANISYPYQDPDNFDDTEDDVDFEDSTGFKKSLFAKVGIPARSNDPSPVFDKRAFVSNDFGAVAEGPGRSAPYPPQTGMADASSQMRLYKNRGPAIGGTSARMGRQSKGPHTYGSKAGWSSTPPMRFDLDDFIVYRLQDMPSNDQRAVMKAAKRPMAVEK